MNVSNLFKQHLLDQPEKTAIIFGDRSISYRELDRQINQIAGGLLQIGLKRGEVVSVFLPSLPELIMSYLGAVRAGLTVNVVNAMLREQEVSYILKDCSARAVLVDDRRLPIVKSVRSALPSLDRVIVLGKPNGDDDISFASLIEKSSDSFEPAATGPDDL